MLQASLQVTLREKKITLADAFAVTDATPVHVLTPLHALLHRALCIDEPLMKEEAMDNEKSFL